MGEAALAERARSATIFDAFSCPWGGSSAALLETLAVEHARNVAEAFGKNHGDQIRSAGDGLVERLERLAEHGADFDTVWDPCIGDAYAGLLQPDGVDVLGCAAAIGLRLSREAPAGAWSVRFDAPRRLRFDRWLLPPAQDLHVAGAPGVISLSGRGPEGDFHRRFARSRTGWDGDLAGELEAMGERALVFHRLSSGDLPEAAARRLLSADAYSFEQSSQSGGVAWRQACRRAAGLIAAAAPDYAPWVAQVVRYLVPVASQERIFNSGSERYSPGVVCLSDHGLTWPLAEMLVHEAAHQYMNLLTFADPLVNGSDERLYYSPFRRKERPLFFILAAYHAFGNVLAFYRQARLHGLQPDEAGLPAAFLQRETELAEQLSALTPVLAATGGLTEAGEALWRPLFEHLA